jgi:hypothetical protein
MAGRSTRLAIVAKQIELRKKFWPLITDEDLWLRKERTGFATLPRSMPLIILIMDGMNKGSPVGAVYLALWCQVMDEQFIEVRSDKDMAFASGFDGERAVRTWRDRMKRLKADGFIDYLPGPNGEITYVLLLNPYHVIRRHKELRHPAITEMRYNALIARTHEIRATELSETLPSDPKTRVAPTASKSKWFDDDVPF